MRVIAVKEKERELLIERIFDAEPDLVFEAWTRPEHLVNWWGPNDFTLPHWEMDLRTGGRYRFCMRSPAGEDHWVWGEYLEIDRPNSLSFTWNREDAGGNIWNSTVVHLTFSEEDSRTRLMLRQALFSTVDDRNDHRGGWGQCLDRLGAFLGLLSGRS